MVPGLNLYTSIYIKYMLEWEKYMHETGPKWWDTLPTLMLYTDVIYILICPVTGRVGFDYVGHRKRDYDLLPLYCRDGPP